MPRELMTRLQHFNAHFFVGALPGANQQAQSGSGKVSAGGLSHLFFLLGQTALQQLVKHVAPAALCAWLPQVTLTVALHAVQLFIEGTARTIRRSRTAAEKAAAEARSDRHIQGQFTQSEYCKQKQMLSHTL